MSKATVKSDNSRSDSEWHEDVKRARVLRVFDDGGRTRVRKQEAHFLAFDLAGDVQQVTRIKADLQGSRAISGAHILGGGAGFRIDHRQGHLVFGEIELHRPGLVGADGGNAV